MELMHPLQLLPRGLGGGDGEKTVPAPEHPPPLPPRAPIPIKPKPAVAPKPQVRTQLDTVLAMLLHL